MVSWPTISSLRSRGRERSWWIAAAAEFADSMRGRLVPSEVFDRAVAARDELVVHDLVAYQSPLTQVLSLPELRTERGGPAALRELLRMEIDADCGQTAGRES